MLETDVHFPTDLNLLWDAGRKCVDLIEKYHAQYDLPGWRKANDWRRRLKALERMSSQAAFGGGVDKAPRVVAAVSDYLTVARDLSAKVGESLLGLCDQPIGVSQWEALDYFRTMLDKHTDLVHRRLLQGSPPPSPWVHTVGRAHPRGRWTPHRASDWDPASSGATIPGLHNAEDRVHLRSERVRSSIG